MNNNAISSDLIRGHIDTIILHALTSGDKFAQQISDAVELKSDNQYKINQATFLAKIVKEVQKCPHLRRFYSQRISNAC